MTELFQTLIEAIHAIRPDVEKAEAGNKAATARVRKAMQEIKAIAQGVRTEMLELRDAGSHGGGDGGEQPPRHEGPTGERGAGGGPHGSGEDINA